MGYTHYWYQKAKPINPATWKEFARDVERILPEFRRLKVDLRFEDTVDAPVKLTTEEVRFNGVRDNGHETFIMERESSRRPSLNNNSYCFSCCKTARKPYDLAVTAVLVIAKHHFKDDIRVSSDGDIDEWAAGMELCARILGYGDKMLFTVLPDGYQGYLEEVK